LDFAAGSRLNPFLDFKTPSLNRIFKIILVVLPLGIIGNIIFTLLKTDFINLFFPGDFRVHYLVSAVLLGFVPWVTHAIRLRRWTRFFNRPISFSRSLYIAIGTELGSAATPTVVGGGYLKLGMLIQDGFTSGSAASLMILGSVEDGLFFAAAVPTAVWMCGGIHRLGLESLFSFRQLDSLWFVSLAIVGAATAAVFLIRRHHRRKNGSRWKRFQDWKKRFVSDFRMVTRLAIGKGGASCRRTSCCPRFNGSVIFRFYPHSWLISGFMYSPFIFSISIDCVYDRNAHRDPGRHRRY
jgi:hypothetical protein